jgi:hypothetical protein
VPADSYVWLAVAPVPDAPSPKVHAYDASVPSGSDEPDASNDAARSETVDVNAAVGSWFGAAPSPRSRWVAITAALSARW